MNPERTERGRLLPGQFELIAKALADPQRFALLEAIGNGAEPMCPNQRLCNMFSVSKATVSHHLKELVHAGLVNSEKDGQYVHFRSRPDVLKAYTTELQHRLGGKTSKV